MTSSDRAALALLFALAPIALPAAAQDAPQAEQAAPDDPPRDPPPPAEDPTAAEAREHFRRGLGLARAGDCSGAIAELEASFRLVARPNTLFNLAQCEERLHRYDRAIARYEEYLRIAPADAEDRVAVEDTLGSLRELLGTIRIESAVSAEVWLEDRIVGEAPGDVLVPGGRHAIELRASGYLPLRREIDVPAREVTTLSVTLERAEQRIEQHVDAHVEQHVTVERPPLPVPVFVVAAGLTVASAVVAGVGGGLALQEHDRIAAMDPRLARDGSSVATLALVADVGIVAGAVFLASTVVIAFLTDWGSVPVEVGASAYVTPDGAGLVAGGAF